MQPECPASHSGSLAGSYGLALGFLKGTTDQELGAVDFSLPDWAAHSGLSSRKQGRSPCLRCISREGCSLRSKNPLVHGHPIHSRGPNHKPGECLGMRVHGAAGKLTGTVHPCSRGANVCFVVGLWVRRTQASLPSTPGHPWAPSAPEHRACRRSRAALRGLLLRTRPAHPGGPGPCPVVSLGEEE